MTQLFSRVPDSKKLYSRFQQDIMDHGKNHEASAINLFLAKNHQRFWLVDQRQISYQTTVNHSFAVVSTPDAIVYDRLRQEQAIVEIKCPWKAFSNGIDVREESVAEELYKPHYYAQIQMQIFTLCTPRCYLVIYVPSKRIEDNFSVFRVERDEEFIQWMLRNCEIAYEERDTPIKYKSYSGEAAYNLSYTLDRMTKNSKYLSNLINN